MEYFERKREKWKSVVAKHPETWYAISALMENKEYTEYINKVLGGKKGGIDLSTALDCIISESEARGEAKGVAKVNKLGLLLTEAGRTADFLKSLSDPIFQQELFTEFGLEEKK